MIKFASHIRARKTFCTVSMLNLAKNVTSQHHMHLICISLSVCFVRSLELLPVLDYFCQYLVYPNKLKCIVDQLMQFQTLTKLFALVLSLTGLVLKNHIFMSPAETLWSSTSKSSEAAKHMHTGHQILDLISSQLSLTDFLH